MATNKKTTAVKKQEQAPPPAPKHYTEVAGLEGIDDEMIIVPRVKLIQPLSVEVDEYKIEPGSLVNSLTKELLAKPEGQFLIVPLMVARSRILFRPLDEGGGLQCRSADGIYGVGDPGGTCVDDNGQPNCPYALWETDKKTGKNKPPKCTEYLNVVVMPLTDKRELIPGNEMPLVLSFGKTSMQAGKMLISLIRMRKISPWHYCYSIKSKFTKKDNYKYYVLQTSPAERAPSKLIDYMEEFYHMMKSTPTEIHIDENEIKREQAKAESATDSSGKEDDVPPF